MGYLVKMYIPLGWLFCKHCHIEYLSFSQFVHEKQLMAQGSEVEVAIENLSKSRKCKQMINVIKVNRHNSY